MQTQPGIFDVIIVGEHGYEQHTTNRSSVIAMLQDDQTKKVNIFVGNTFLKTYVRMSWAIKFAQFIPSRSVEFALYTKGVFNRG